VDSKVILTTPRLVLSEFTPEDAPFIFKLLNTPGWIKYIGTRNINTENDARDYINNKLITSYKQHGFGFYNVRKKDDDEAVGMCGIIKREHLDDPDIGFALLPEYEGNGYAYESASAVMDYAKDTLKFKRLSAITVPFNKSSIKLIEKIGLNFEKMIHENNEHLMLFNIKF
jgi:RimJ/RimL family protein N-acetyltransferase